MSSKSPYRRPRRPLATRRRTILTLLDVGILVVSFWIAYLLRFDFAIPDSYLTAFWIQLPIVVGIQLVGLEIAGIPSFIWRYIGLREARAFGSAAAFALVPLLVLRAAAPAQWDAVKVPVSVLLMDCALAFGGMLAARVARRVTFEQRARSRRAGASNGNGHDKRIVIIGAGRAGVLAVREMQGRGDVGMDIVGFLDDDPLKHGMVIDGVRVLGGVRRLTEVVQTHSVQEAIVAIAEPTPEVMRKIHAECERAGIGVRTMPGLYEVLQGKVAIDRFRQVSPEDLLAREPVTLDQAHVYAFIEGRRVMITGAGGSIGSELVRQVASLNPAEVILVERAEFALFAIDREIRRRYPDLASRAVVADVGDRRRMQAVFRAARPEVVIHAAAHKHVPLMEHNPHEAVRNNVLATNSLAVMAGQFDVQTFVLISTDKAVRPTSVMGATKRLAELVIQDLNDRFDTKYVAVRFGNVMGSIGSVIPIFEEQIRIGGPVTVTHPEMRRYFMTIPEAVTLVLEASTMGDGGEIFILDMGEPVRIVDLAERLIRLHGYTPYSEIPIVFSGVRPGEKLFEELGHDAEDLASTRHPQVLIGRIERPSHERVEEALRTMDAFASGTDPEAIRAFMSDFLGQGALAAGSRPERREA